ncbi:MAG: cation:proton antiporter [Paludibacter sp.]|jgi:Kef-type K+ transport system membrane component KefB|nr:cation:proton antiporter [Paludibacter sp.]
MKKHLKTWIFYGGMMLLFVVLTYVLFSSAAKFDTEVISENSNDISLSTFENFRFAMMHNIMEPAAMLLLQIISILLVSRVFGFLFVKIGQPTVIGEILAGIVLGPSLLGYFFPEAYSFLFTPDSLSNIYILSEIGLVLFMFVIGMELDLSALKNKMGTTFVISQASIVIPYFMGMWLAYYLYEEFAAGQTDFISFALFIGISMSITAFPVLARIVQEKGLTKSHLGTISIASAAFNDVTAWCVLAAVIAISKTGSLYSSLFNIGLAVAYILVMMFLVKPFLKRIGEIYKNSEVVNKSVFAFFLLVLIISAYITQLIGIHALFGAFLAGVIMPPLPSFRKLIVDKVEDVSLTLLLPLFFVYTGLRTEIGLLNTPYLWWVAFIFIVVAVVGKFIGSAFSAKVLGETWKDSLSIGILMNTRGLMELIVLNIGYEMGILPPPIFVMLVIMALVTTFMTTPILSLINFLFPEKRIREEYERHQSLGIFKALIAMGNPENGKPLLNVAKTVLDGTKNSLAVNVLHLTPGTDINPFHGDQYSHEGFKLVNEEAAKLNIPIETEYKITDNIEGSIVRTVNYNNYDFLLVGAGVALSGIPFFKETTFLSKIKWLNRLLNRVSRTQSIFYPGSLIKDKTRYFIENSRCSVGVFVNRGFAGISTTMILLQNESDDFLLRYARRLMRNNKSVSIFIMDVNQVLQRSAKVREATDELHKMFPNSVKIIKSSKNNASVISKFSFLLLSYQTWNDLSENDAAMLRSIPSTLIINKKTSRFHSRNAESGESDQE